MDELEKGGVSYILLSLNKLFMTDYNIEKNFDPFVNDIKLFFVVHNPKFLDVTLTCCLFWHGRK